MSDDPELTRTLNAWSETFLHHSMHEFKKFMDECSLSPSQMITLFRLYHGEPCSISAVGSLLGISNAASSQLIDRLVLQGLVERVEDPIDRRVKQLVITTKGKTLVAQGINARRQWMETLTNEMTSEQLAIVISALSMLTSCASNIRER